MISLLCPSRGRPEFARALLDSARATAAMQHFQLVLRLDDDDPRLPEYADQVSGSDVTTIIGPRITLSQCWNEAADKAIWEVLALLGDDIRFRSPDWDKLVMDAIWDVPDRIVLVHGRDGIQDSAVATHPFMHRRWMETVGHFVPPYFASDWNDMWLTEVADALGRRRFLPEVYTEHLHPVVGKHYLDQTHMERLDRHRQQDCDRIYRETSGERAADIAKLRAAMFDPTVIPRPGVAMSQPDQNQPTPEPLDYPAIAAAQAAEREAAERAKAAHPDDPEDLKGQALDKALKDAGLSTSGTADEKRARLAEAADQ